MTLSDIEIDSALMRERERETAEGDRERKRERERRGGEKGLLLIWRFDYIHFLNMCHITHNVISLIFTSCHSGFK